tara:strand:+ start:26059 stop:29427 length:3369 start_codon:yes stop_codon:yes gene_type:complete
MKTVKANKEKMITKKNIVSSLIIAGIVLMFSINLVAQSLEQSFLNPPNSVKPRTWMHAMSGNMSKVGMTKDLEAISDAGQGGVLLFNVANGIPYGNVPYNSDEHQSIIAHAAKECERLELSFGVHNCSGWSSSGGPWVTPEQSMKMVVWSETIVDGGSEIEAILPQPTTIEGFYRDIAVIAYPSLETELIDAEAKPIVTASDENFNVDLATDKKNSTPTRLSKGQYNNPWVTFDYGKEHEISSLYISLIGDSGIEVQFEKSNDGENFTPVSTIKGATVSKKKVIISDQFDPVKARYFRFSFDKDFDIREIELRTTRMFDNYIAYSGIGTTHNYYNGIKEPKPGMVIEKESIMDLSSSMTNDGMLNTNLPKGKWTVMRFGYTSLGAVNWPASKWGIGLECDKFDRNAFKSHFDAFAQKVINNSQKNAPNALQYIEIDSYEMGGQNWTENFNNIFKKEKGYDIIPLLPFFAGRYIDSAETVSDIAYDLNDTYCNLMTNNYFKYFTELCNKNGLKSYVEPYGHGPVNTLDAVGQIDIPMDEFWVNRDNLNVFRTVTGSHIYGKNKISAEAFTSRPELNWKVHPALAKATGDLAWTEGINEFMFHRFVHQANTHVKPGLTMGFWGSHFDRNQTWWMNAGKSWFTYIARGSHLLRQGYPVADVLVFVGDGPHRDAPVRKKLEPTIPQGINYDCSNADVLINRITIKDKTLVLPEGNAYRYLVLHDVNLTTLPTLRRIKEIVDAGVPVIGSKPVKLAGYKVSKEENKEFDELCSYIWSQPNCTTTFDLTGIQSDFKVKGYDRPFVHRKSTEGDIYFFFNDKDEQVTYECLFRIANKLPELWDANTGNIIKLANYKSEGASTRLWLNLKPKESAFIVFRDSVDNDNTIIGENADKNIYFKANNTVAVESENSEATTFIWSDGETSEIKAIKFPEPLDLSSNWNVEFLEEHDFASEKEFQVLSDWKDDKDEGIKYYSGTAIYTKSFKMPKNELKELRYILDLGEVDVVAEVVVNGINLGVIWIAPFEVDITDQLQKGENHLEIKITNQWSNRLIGDENYPQQDGGYQKSSYIPADDSKMPDWYINNEPMPAGPRTTFSSWDFYKKGDELLPSGLKGPVKIKYKRIIEIDN